MSSITLIASCTNSPAPITQDIVDTGPTYNTETPISFNEYKSWRETNDPAGTAYAEFKEWEIAYRSWKAQQEN